jgi:hypothetical protein
MSAYPWKSEPIKVGERVVVDVRASDKSVVLGQGDDVWFHDLHLSPERAIDVAEALTAGAAHCLAARGER